MANFKRNLKIHTAVFRFVIVLMLCALAEFHFLYHSRLVYYPAIALFASGWLAQQMRQHCKWYRHAISVSQQIVAAQTIPFPPLSPRHRNINYQTVYKQRGKYAK